MEMDRPPARMQICLSPGRETENLFGVALPRLPIHFTGKNGTIELGSHLAIWSVLKLQLLLAASLYM